MALVAIPALPALVLLLSILAGPMVAAVVGLLAYWAALGGALLAWADRDWLIEWLTLRAPGRLATLLLVLPVLGLGAAALRLLGQEPLAGHLILLAAMAAVIHAVLEELFWRGALIPEPTPGSAAVSLGLYTFAQAAWLGLGGLETGTPGAALMMAALALGGVWTASRLLSGTVGAGVLAHAGVNLFAFVQVLALNAQS